MSTERDEPRQPSLRTFHAQRGRTMINNSTQLGQLNHVQQLTTKAKFEICNAKIIPEIFCLYLLLHVLVSRGVQYLPYVSRKGAKNRHGNMRVDGEHR